MSKIKYYILPQHCQLGMRLYIEEGVIPGSFLQAVICNKLVEAYACADDINTYCMRDYAQFLYDLGIPEAWGSEERMKEWAAHKGLAGINKSGS